MIAVDTNILARFYVDDPSDPEAVKQRPIARRVISESQSLFVPQSVILELEWVVDDPDGLAGTPMHRAHGVEDELLDLFEGTKMLPSDPLNPDFDPTWVPGRDGPTE